MEITGKMCHDFYFGKNVLNNVLNTELIIKKFSNVWNIIKELNDSNFILGYISKHPAIKYNILDDEYIRFYLNDENHNNRTALSYKNKRVSILKYNDERYFVSENINSVRAIYRIVKLEFKDENDYNKLKMEITL